MSMNLTLTLPNKNQTDLWQMNTLETNAVLAESTTEARVQKYLSLVLKNICKVSLPRYTVVSDWFRNNPYTDKDSFKQTFGAGGVLGWSDLNRCLKDFDMLQMYYSTEQRVLKAVAEGAVFSKR